MAKRSKPTEVLVVVQDRFRNRGDELAKALEKEGLHVDQIMGLGGTISGSIAADKIKALRTHEGVEDVLPQDIKTIDPHDSPVQ